MDAHRGAFFGTGPKLFNKMIFLPVSMSKGRGGGESIDFSDKFSGMQNTFVRNGIAQPRHAERRLMRARVPGGEYTTDSNM